MKFCSEVGREPLPASEELLCWFVARLHERGVKLGTCRSYVAAVRAHHLEKGVTLCDGQSRRLQAVLKGVQRREAGVAKRVRRPVTPAVLKKLQPVWCVGVSAADGTMLWAACCVGYFGFLRVGEFTTPKGGAFDPLIHLSWSDVAVDRAVNPRVVQFQLKATKTDPFRNGARVCVGAVGGSLCPVKALLQYLSTRGSAEGPLFRFESGVPLSRSRFVGHLQGALARAGLSETEFNGHSLRIGAATVAGRSGMPEAVLKSLGRWSSSAYTAYVRTPASDLAVWSQVLAEGH